MVVCLLFDVLESYSSFRRILLVGSSCYPCSPAVKVSVWMPPARLCSWIVGGTHIVLFKLGNALIALARNMMSKYIIYILRELSKITSNFSVSKEDFT